MERFHMAAVRFYFLIVRGTTIAGRVLTWAWRNSCRPLDWMAEWANSAAGEHLEALREILRKKLDQ